MKEPLRMVTAALFRTEAFLVLSNLSRDCKQMPAHPGWGSVFYQPPVWWQKSTRKWKTHLRCSVPYRQPIRGPRDALKRAHRRYRKLEITSRSFEGTSLWSRTMVITAGLSLLSLYFQAHRWSLGTTGGTCWGLGLHHDSAQLSRLNRRQQQRFSDWCRWSGDLSGAASIITEMMIRIHPHCCWLRKQKVINIQIYLHFAWHIY